VQGPVGKDGGFRFQGEKTLVPRQSAAGEKIYRRRCKGQLAEMAASGFKSEKTLVPRQSAAGEKILSTELQGPAGKDGGFRFQERKDPCS
jgi:hypothetical protein